MPVADTRIFQIYYREDQKPHLDRSFSAYDNRGDSNLLLEFNVFRKLAASRQVAGADYWGAVSWKFREKTGLSGEELLKTIHTNPGYDVYFCNPHPEMEALFPNLWIQGDVSHPGLLNLASGLLGQLGISAHDQINLLWPAKSFAAANYIVGTPSFWSAYLGFVEAVILAAEGLPESLRLALVHGNADPNGWHAGASFWSFIIERLFAVFMLSTTKSLTGARYPVRSRLMDTDSHLQRLHRMREDAFNTRSMAALDNWQGYRDSYLLARKGQNWVDRKIKPDHREIRGFAETPENIYLL